jgi:hypothetical protein
MPDNLTKREQIDYERDYTSKSKLQALNLADIKNISNPSVKSIAHHLILELLDLSIWGNYSVTNDGFLEICTAR